MRASEFIVENLGMPYPGTYEQEYQHKSGQRRIGTLTTEEASTNSTTLSKLYNGQYPDRDELFWDYVQKDDLNKELTVHTFSPIKLKILLQSQYRVEDVEEIFDMLDDDRLEIIDHYKKDPNLSQSIIVVANNRIIDGNHRYCVLLEEFGEDFDTEVIKIPINKKISSFTFLNILILRVFQKS